MRFNYQPSATISLSLFLMLTVSSCASNSSIANSSKDGTIYQYKHQCTKKDQPVEHFITAKEPLTLNELALLKSTLEENLGLDFDSCEFIGSVNE
jgi:hypothetical protein